MNIELSLNDLEMLQVALARNLQPVFTKQEQANLIERIRAAVISENAEVQS